MWYDTEEQVLLTLATVSVTLWPSQRVPLRPTVTLATLPIPVSRLGYTNATLKGSVRVVVALVGTWHTVIDCVG